MLISIHLNVLDSQQFHFLLLITKTKLKVYTFIIANSNHNGNALEYKSRACGTNIKLLNFLPTYINHWTLNLPTLFHS